MSQPAIMEKLEILAADLTAVKERLGERAQESDG
jgi:hypothetical protein